MKQSKLNFVYEYLKNAIITGKYPPEKQLVEQVICEELNVSRTPVREALRRLDSEGLIDSYPGRGVFVAGLSQEKASQLYEVKEALEGMAARLCAERASKESVEKLEDCIARHREAFEKGEVLKTADTDLEFHALLLAGAENPILEQEGQSLLMRARRLSQLSVYDTHMTDRFISQHQAILDGIKEKNPERAMKAVSEHIQFIRTFQWERWAMLF